jgi:hypothetical protein
VLNAGDITDGYGMRKGQEFTVFKHGADQQVRYVVDNYPKYHGIETWFITGNHDHSFIKSAGYDIGKVIARERADMKYLGANNARLYPTPNCSIELNHGMDGGSYALSYAIQKCIEAMPENDLPNVFINGHHHKAIYVYYRGVHCLEAATTQAQTDWMRGKRLPAHVGAWIITVHVDDDGFISEFENKLLPCKNILKDDY